MAQQKTGLVSLEEGGFAIFLVLLAFACLIVAGKTFDQVMAFHASVGALFAALGVFYIFKNYFDDGGQAIPQELDGKPNYNIGPIKFGAIAAMFWGIAGFTVGLVIALQLAWPALNFDLPWTNFGRLRPLHTSAVIFAFGGNVLLATSMYVVQRTCRARMPGKILPWFVILGYNAFIVMAGTGYLLGIHPEQGIRRTGMVR
jgi:cytochrome c oxidase cbb3-type subunit 1